jgi:aspartokinase/homoserine dehydrogenase 1
MKTVNIFLIGTGVIGSALLEQIVGSNQGIKVIGIANSDRMMFDTAGIALSSWKTLLEKGEKNSLDNIVSFLERAAVQNKILVDCTANEKVAGVYTRLLETGISVVCANKIANTGSLSQYNELRVAAKKGNAQFLYETNVGAGLPLLSTLQDLVATGDEIIKIEGIMSGTLSYIFNTFVGDTPFSEVVKKAKELGYTEPDPRIDLSGADVGRKLLILAREIGMQLEPETIVVESLVPKPLQADMSVDTFFEKTLIF